jgi:hypothetical protein
MTDTELSELLHTHTPEPPPSIDLTAMAARIQTAPDRRRRLIPMTAAAAVIATVAVAGGVARLPGDGSAPAATSGKSTSTADSGTPAMASGPRPSPAQLAWARMLVDRWTGQAFVPLGDDWNFQEVGAWTDPAGSQQPYFFALNERRITSRIDLGSAPQVPLPAPRWADGRPLPLPVLSLRSTFDRLLAGGCRGCAGAGHLKLKTLTVTSVSPSTMRVQTARGSAVLPAWRFTFAETSVQALQAAVDPLMAAVPMSSSATSAPSMGQIDRVRVAGADGRNLIASFMSVPCGQRYAGYAVETDSAVGIVLVASNPGNKACAAPAGLGHVTVHLAAPLNDRVVIETAHGTAVQGDH